MANLTDLLVPYFEGKESWENAMNTVCEQYSKLFAEHAFICSVCHEIIPPKVSANEHGIFMESARCEVRGGIGNHILQKDICEECRKKMTMKA